MGTWRSLSLEDRTVNEVVAAASVSLKLATVGMLFALIMGLGAGIIGAIYRGRWPDNLLMGIAVGGMCIRTSSSHRCW